MTGGYLKDCKEFFQEIVMLEKSKRARRSFSSEFKQAAVDLAVKQGDSFKAPADALVLLEESQRLAREAGSRV